MSTTTPPYLQVCTRCTKGAVTMYYCTHITYNQGPFCAECYDQVKTDHELNKALDSALEKMVKNSKNMDPEFQDVINKHFWKILY